MQFRVVGGSIILLFVLNAVSVQSALLLVPDQYLTISSALSQSTEGDTVLVAPGLYRDKIAFPTGSRTVASHILLTGDTTLIQSTILEPSAAAPLDSQSIVYVTSPLTNAVLTGFTLQNGHGTLTAIDDTIEAAGGAVLMFGGGLRMEHCVLEHNDAFIAGAVYCTSATQFTLEHCVIRFDSSITQTLAIFDSRVRIANSLIYGNTALAGGVIRHIVGPEMILENVRVDSNVNPRAFLSTVLVGSVNAVCISNCVFSRNEIDTTRGVCAGLMIGVGTAIVDQCIFRSNLAESASALALWFGMDSVRHCQFENNRTTWAPGTVEFGYEQYVFEDCVFRSNEADWWSCLSGMGSLVLNRCEFTDNLCRDSAHDSNAVVFAPPDSLYAARCAFANNTGAAITDLWPSDYINVENCYWGDPSGPFHATLNPNGRGDTIFSDIADFTPWLTEPPAAVEPEPDPVPASYELLRVYPNPFNPVCTLDFNVPRRALTTLTVYDLTGRTVRTLSEGWLEPGLHSLRFDGSDLPSGVYFARLQSGTLAQTRKLVLLK